MEKDNIFDSDDQKSGASAKANPLVVPAAIVVAGALISAAVIYSNSASEPAERSGSPSGGSAAVAAAGQRNEALADLSDDDPFLGDPSAPVTIVEFGDYQCPFCRRFFQTTRREIMDQYVKTGKAKLVYRDFPLNSIHEEAQKAAEASECADEQGKFWEYHDLLYSRQGDLSVANYKKWAAELGLDQAAFTQCLDTGKFEAEVLQDLSSGQSAGVNGTPATFVNGRLIPGAQAFGQFRTIIEEELARAEK